MEKDERNVWEKYLDIDKEQEELEQEDKELDTCLGMSLDNIMFMKRYFQSQGFDPTDEDFITEVLKSKLGYEFDEQQYSYSTNDTIPVTFTYTKGTGSVNYIIQSMREIK
jgi:hypothetical protein